jgi:branched-chain amino acid aminotransferase
MTERIAYFNGDYIPESEVRISMYDRGFLYGDGAYDIARTFRHRPFRLAEHVDRLFRSLKYIGLDIGLTAQQVFDITLEVFERNRKLLDPEDDFLLIQRISRGVGGFVPEGSPTMIIHCAPIPFDRFVSHYQEGIHLALVSTRRTPPQCLDPRAKLHNKLNHIQAEKEARAVDPQAFALMLDLDGYVAEGPSYNVLMVRERTLLSPRDQNILEGVTRDALMELAPKIGLDVLETNLTPYDLYTADELLIVSTSYTLFPVATFNGRRLAGELPGPVTRQILKAWADLTGVDIIDQARRVTALRAPGRR